MVDGSSPPCSRSRRGAHHGPRSPNTKLTVPSSRAFHTHYGQVASAGREVNIDLDLRTWLALDQRYGPCTRRTTWPVFTRLVTWLAVGRITTGIDLIRRPSAQRHMRPVLVVPINRRADLMAKGTPVQRHQRHATEQHLEREDQAFDDRQAPMLADGATAWRLDPLTSTPTLEAVAVELGPLSYATDS